MYRVLTTNLEGKAVERIRTPDLFAADYHADLLAKENGWACVQVNCEVHGWTNVLVDQCVDCFDDAVDDWYTPGI